MAKSKQTEQVFARNLDLAMGILENIPVPILITDAGGVITWANQAYVSYTGYTVDVVQGNTLHLVRSKKGQQAPSAVFKTALSEDGKWQGEIWNRNKDGEAVLTWLTVGPMRDADDEITHYIASFTDISAIKRSEAEAKRLAYHDSLTGLPNRLLFADRLRHALARCRRHKTKVALLYVDLDGFKGVNDYYGHDGGDELLRGIASRLKETLREEDTLARLGGDEFGVVAADITDEPSACRVAERVLDAIQKPFTVQGGDVTIGASVGVVVSDPDRFTTDELMKKADQAMYQAKSVGKNRYAIVRGFQPKNVTPLFD